MNRKEQHDISRKLKVLKIDMLLSTQSRRSQNVKQFL